MYRPKMCTYNICVYILLYIYMYNCVDEHPRQSPAKHIPAILGVDGRCVLKFGQSKAARP